MQRLSKADIRVLCALVVIGVVVCLILVAGQGRGSGDTRPSSNAPPTTTATTGASNSLGLASPLSLALQKQAEKAARLYVAYPNKAGTQATLEQLRPLVDKQVLQSIATQWQGPEVTTVSVDVSAVKFVSAEFLDAKKDKVIMQALATQKFTFVGTPTESHDLLVNVLLQRGKGTWQVVGLGIVGDGD